MDLNKHILFIVMLANTFFTRKLPYSLDHKYILSMYMKKQLLTLY